MIYKFTNRLLLFLITALFLFGAGSCTLSESGMQRSSGSINELLVVTNDKPQWEGEPGDTIREFFGGPTIGLSQPEPMFDILNIAQKNLNDLFKRYHNIFIVDINPDFTQPLSETSKNLWSEPQRVIKVTAPSLASFYEEFEKNKETFLQLFIQLERERTLAINQMATNIQLAGTLERKFNIFLPIPGGFYLAKEAPDFAWVRHKITKVKQDTELSILIYTMDYKDTIVFNPRHIIQWRNTITLEHIPGPSPLSFMKVSEAYIPPVFNVITDFPGGYAVETRGLWEVENDFMGGSFINYTFIDQANNKVITLDGYVYNPNNDKKNYLRQLESIFFALKFSKEE
ncbi:MAG: DUF4837 family protein [Bacteroidales bacterium]|nr:DUF4837 family protein [Bacteroidales bacterium]